ncbi:hypothetical protein Tco_0465474 [Tanacetum coccineum]
MVNQDSGQLSSQRAMPMPTQDLFCKRTMAPQVGWMSSSQAGPDGPFPKRLGVELSRRDSPQANRQLMSPMGTNVQATSTGQTHQFLHKQSTLLADHLRQPSIASEWCRNCEAESANISSTEAYVRCDTTNFRKRMEDVLYYSFSIQIAHAIFSPDDLSLLDSSVPSLVATYFITALFWHQGGAEAETKSKSLDAEGDEDMDDADETVKSVAGGKKDPALRRREFLVESGLAVDCDEDYAQFIGYDIVSIIHSLLYNHIYVLSTMGIQVVLNTFKAQPLNDEDGAANNLEDEAVTFSIKYLTSSNLMGLEF